MRRSRLKHQTAARFDSHSSVPYSLLTKKEMMTRMKQLHNELTKLKKQKDRLRKRIDCVVQSNGITLDHETNKDFNAIINTHSQLLKENSLNTFQTIFWEQQATAARLNNAKGMRWHPLMIKWCIYLRYHSQKAYGTLRESKCITLPSQRTLRDYTHHIETKPGFSTKVDTEICRAAKIEQCIEREKFVILLLDEIHVKEDLMYNKHTGKLIGFSFLNEIRSDLDSLEEKVTESSFPPELLANSMMTFMVRGLFTHLEYPYVYFPTRNVTGSLLIDPLWETVDRLERHGFKV